MQRRSTPLVEYLLSTRFWLLILATLASFAIVKAAWLSDDAYITLRTVDNFWNGYGLRWNVLERVQTYTHPLWMLLLAAAYGGTREAYFTTIALSLACAALTIALLIRRLPPASAVLALLLLISSRAFVEFSTSGLENPLSHLLLVLFWLDALLDVRRPTRFCLCAALCCLTRADLVLLVGPRVLAWLWRRPPGAWRSLACGALPLIVWYGFATIYYGTPLPNTVLAKLNTGAPVTALLEQGGYYLLDSLLHDPATLGTIASACVWAMARPNATTISLAIGLLLQTLFILRVGGDFMSGRFLSAPFVCAATVMAWHAGPALARRRLALATVACLIGVMSLAVPKSPWRVWDPLPQSPRVFPEFHGVGDERAFYLASTGLLIKLRDPAHRDPWFFDAQSWRGVPRVVVLGGVGHLGFYAGPAVHIVDNMALTDPLLARLPARPGWRIGHFARDLPAGYVESLEACLRHVFPHGATTTEIQSCLAWPAETNHLTDPGLAAKYDLIRTVTEQPLFDTNRLRALIRLNLGLTL